MSGKYLVAALIFIGVSLLLMFLLTRLSGLRGQKDESPGSQEHWTSGDVDGGDGGGDGGD